MGYKDTDRYKHGNEPSGAVKEGECFNYQLLEKDFVRGVSSQ
jgi:hypothetical protein